MKQQYKTFAFTNKSKLVKTHLCYGVIYDDYIGKHIEETTFDNYDDAVSAAKRVAAYRKEDVSIWKIDSVATFPIPDIEIVKVD